MRFTFVPNTMAVWNDIFVRVRKSKLAINFLIVDVTKITSRASWNDLPVSNEMNESLFEQLSNNEINFNVKAS